MNFVGRLSILAVEVAVLLFFSPPKLFDLIWIKLGAGIHHNAMIIIYQPVCSSNEVNAVMHECGSEVR